MCMKLKLNLSKNNTIVLKIVAICWVIFGHANLIDSAGSWGVTLFLFLSGYGLSCSKSNANSITWLTKHVTKIYIPYIIVISIQLIVEMCFRDVSYKSIIISLVGLDFGYNIDPSMWYISYLVLWYVFFWLANRSKKYFDIILIVASFIFLVLGYTNFIWHAGTISWAYCLAFSGGCLYKKYEDLNILKWMIFFASVIAIMYVVLRYGQVHYRFDGMFFAYTAPIIAVFVVVLFNNILAERIQIQVSSGFLSEIIFGIYLFEGFIFVNAS